MSGPKLWCIALPLLVASWTFAGKIQPGDEAPPAMPLALSDGTRLNLDDARGKVVVLYFYEQSCPSCRKMVPERNAWLEKYKDKPVRFIAIGAGDSAAEVQTYARDAQLRLPVTPDPLSLVEKSWGIDISLKNIYQTRVIGVDGKLSGYSVDSDFFERALAKAQWKYPREDYDQALVPVLDKFEWGELDAGVKLLKQAKRSNKKPIAESAAKFAELLKSESQSQFDEAVGLIESEPVKAYDLLTRVALVMDGEPLAKQADEKLKPLKTSAPIKDELSARKMLDQMVSAQVRAKPGQERDINGFAQSIIKKYPETPTAKRVEQIVATWQ